MRRGFTLVEMLVVLVLLALALAVVAPTLLPSRKSDERDTLTQLFAATRDAAVRRGEVVHLRVEESGSWRADGAASDTQGPLASGRLSPSPVGAPFTLVLSPLGGCAFDVRSGAAARAVSLDPLTCETS